MKLGTTFPRKHSLECISKIQDTCGSRTSPTFRSKQATKSLSFFQSPKQTNTIKSREYPHFHNAHVPGLSPSRRLQRKSAKTESCIRNFLLRTVLLLSHFHGWWVADPRALQLGVRPQRRITGSLTGPKGTDPRLGCARRGSAKPYCPAAGVRTGAAGAPTPPRRAPPGARFRP